MAQQKIEHVVANKVVTQHTSRIKGFVATCAQFCFHILYEVGPRVFDLFVLVFSCLRSRTLSCFCAGISCLFQSVHKCRKMCTYIPLIQMYSAPVGHSSVANKDAKYNINMYCSRFCSPGDCQHDLRTQESLFLVLMNWCIVHLETTSAGRSCWRSSVFSEVDLRMRVPVGSESCAHCKVSA